MSTETTTFYIPNISCHHCVHTIKTELADLAGVKSIDADMPKKMVTVVYEPPANTDEIEALLSEINYPAASRE